MHKLDKIIILCLATFAIAAAKAETLIPVIPPAGTANGDYAVFSINDDNIIGGRYATADGKLHAFFGSLDGQYTTFDYGNGAQVDAINNSGLIVGTSDSKPFERTVDGTITTITKDGNPITSGNVWGLNNKGIFVGRGFFGQSDFHCFFGRDAQYLSEFTTSLGECENEVVSLGGINDSNAVVGSIYFRTGGQAARSITHGFVSQNGVGTLIDYPDGDAVVTGVFGINNKGLVAGYWVAKKNYYHAFKYDIRTNTFTLLMLSAKSSTAWGVNNSGLIALNTNKGAYIYCPKSRLHCPSNGQTFADAKPIRGAPPVVLRR